MTMSKQFILFVFTYVNHHLSGLAVCTVQLVGIPTSSLVHVAAEFLTNVPVADTTDIQEFKQISADISVNIALT